MIGARIGPRIGACVGPPANDPLAGVTRDATSLIYTPNTAAEWTTLLTVIGSALVAPQHLWRMQEAAGNPADSIGSKTLTASGSGAYQKSITGWARKAIGGSGVAVNASIANTAMADTATTSYLALGLVRFDPAPASLRSLITYGTPTVQAPAATNKVRLREGGALVDSTNAHNATVHPLVLAFNVTNSTVKLYSDLEKLSVAFSASTGTALTLTLSASADTSVTDFLYFAAWDGSAGETTDAQVKTLLTGMGFAPPWS